MPGPDTEESSLSLEERTRQAGIIERWIQVVDRSVMPEMVPFEELCREVREIIAKVPRSPEDHTPGQPSEEELERLMELRQQFDSRACDPKQPNAALRAKNALTRLQNEMEAEYGELGGVVVRGLLHEADAPCTAINGFCRLIPAGV